MRKNLKFRIPPEENPYFKVDPEMFRKFVELIENCRYGFYRRLRGKDMKRMLEWLDSRLPLLKNGEYTVATKCHWLVHGLTRFPKCAVCGHELSVEAGFRRGSNVSPFSEYGRYCSKACMVRDPETYIKGRRTRLERHGSETWSNREKARETLAERRRKPADESEPRLADNRTVPEKIRETCREKYGMDWPTMRPEIQEKTKQTCIRKYGVQFALQLDETKRKSNKTCLEKYGHEHFTQTEKFKSLFKNDKFRTNWFNKQLESKIRNGTFRKSTKEDECFWILKFVHPRLERQYRSAAYPFACDFHDPDSDTYFEFNGTWTHGGRFFDPCSKEDSKKLEIWKKKAEMSKFYENAIRTWTIRDVKKLKTVKKNGLRYVVFWNVDEARKYVLNCEYP